MAKILSKVGVALKQLQIELMSGDGEGSSAFAARIAKSDLDGETLEKLKRAEFFVEFTENSFAKAHIEGDGSGEDPEFIYIAGQMSAERLW